MKALYVSHHARPCYEFDWFAQLPVEELRILDTDFSKYPKDPPEHVRYCPVGYTPVPSLHSTAQIVFYSGYERYLEGIDVVIVLEAFSSLSSQFVRYCRSAHIPVVVLVYELIATHPIYKLPPYRFFTKSVLKHADKFISITDAAKEHLKNLGVDGSRIETVSPGIDTALFYPGARQNATQDVIFVGKLEAHKGIDAVIATYFTAIKPHADRRLTIVGDGSHRERIERLVADGERIEYHPFIPHDDLAGTLRKHSVFIMPARDTFRMGQKIGAEQFCFAIIEAMACGLAVVTTDCGAIPEVVGDENYVCPQDGLTDFPQFVDRALGHPDTTLGTKNAARVEQRYSQQTQARQLYDILRSVAK